MEKNLKKSPQSDYKQHWLVAILRFSRPNVVSLTNSHIMIEERFPIQGGKKKIINKNTSHPVSTSSIEDKFQMSVLWTWLITLPVSLFGLIFGRRIPMFYGTVIIKSDSGGVSVVKYLTNYKDFVNKFKNLDK